MVKAPGANIPGAIILRGTSDGIAGDGDERELRLFLPFYFFTFLHFYPFYFFTFLPLKAFYLFTQFLVSVSKVMDQLPSTLMPYELGMAVVPAHLLLSAIALRV